MELIDSHTHLDFPDFDEDRQALLAESRALGVRRMVVLGVYQGNWQRVWDLVQSDADLYAAFGLHPVFHHNERRTEGHLFITVLAYQLVQTIRHKLKAAGETMSWSRLREILSVQQRVTATFRQRDRRTLHVRKTTAAEPALRRIYDTLGIDAAPGGVRKFTM